MKTDMQMCQYTLSYDGDQRGQCQHQEKFLQINKDIPPLWKTKSPENHGKQLKAVCYDYLIKKKTERNKKVTPQKMTQACFVCKYNIYS